MSTRQPNAIPDDCVARRRLARVLDVKTGSIARADQRRKGPGGGIHLSRTFVVYPLANVIAFCRERGLEWTGDGVRPLPKSEPTAATGGGAP
jgi:hypothetical protein